MKDQALNTLMKQLDVLAAEPIYPIGTKIYRVLDNGDVLMEKVEAYRIDVQPDGVRFTHIGGNGYGVSIPDNNKHQGYGYGSRIHSWHFDRKAANKAAAPLQAEQRVKKIEANKRRIAEIEAENAELEKQ